MSIREAIKKLELQREETKAELFELYAEQADQKLRWTAYQESTPLEQRLELEADIRDLEAERQHSKVALMQLKAWLYVESVTFERDKEATDVNLERPIHWEVGQVVWDLVHGKGAVDCLEEDSDYPIKVCFEAGGYESFTPEGKYLLDGNRTLFFSEPKIIADEMPPKKPFTPTLKEGDVVVMDTIDRQFITTIDREEEDEVFIKRQVSGVRYPKRCIKLYKLGEEIKFKEN